VGGKRLLQVVFGGVKGKISHEQFCAHLMICCSGLTVSGLFPTPGFQIITESLHLKIYHDLNDKLFLTDTERS
jgi:hypothetical protein